MRFSKLVLTLLCVIALMPQMVSHAQQERGLSTQQPNSKAEPRIALVIGNSAYQQSPLTNPANDARDMAATLRSLGFEVMLGENQNQTQMKRLIREFGQKIRNGGVGLFYFAGHGVQVTGRNYLIPVGAEINSEAEVEYEGIDAGFVLAQMEEARNRLNIVVLDACRNNPFARSFRSGSRGLAATRSAPTGTLVAYATAADDVASDGGGRNGLFTQELLANLKTPGLTLEQVFRRTRTSVRSKSNGQQVPYEYTSVEGEDFYFLQPTSSTNTVASGAVSKADPPAIKTAAETAIATPVAVGFHRFEERPHGYSFEYPGNWNGGRFNPQELQARGIAAGAMFRSQEGEAFMNAIWNNLENANTAYDNNMVVDLVIKSLSAGADFQGLSEVSRRVVQEGHQIKTFVGLRTLIRHSRTNQALEFQGKAVIIRTNTGILLVVAFYSKDSASTIISAADRVISSARVP